MPIWAAILVGLGGGVVGTLLSISHQRASEFRTRMLDAAANLLVHAEATRRAIRNPQGEGGRDAAAVARERWDELVPHVMMVELLFGRASLPADLARSAGGDLLELVQLLEARRTRSGIDDDQAELGAAAWRLDDWLNAFTTAAADQVRETWLTRHSRRRRTLIDYAPKHVLEGDDV